MPNLLDLNLYAVYVPLCQSTLSKQGNFSMDREGMGRYFYEKILILLLTQRGKYHHYMVVLIFFFPCAYNTSVIQNNRLTASHISIIFLATQGSSHKSNNL